MKVYEKLANYLKVNGIKQSCVAKQTGIPENTLSMIINGKLKLDAEKLRDIIIALNIDPSILITPVKNSSNEKSDTE